MTTQVTPRRIQEPGYLRWFYRQLDDVRDDYFDALIITGAPIETLPFENVKYYGADRNYGMAVSTVSGGLVFVGEHSILWHF